ncbi:hypothetical protein [Flavobacterium taihuense]|uniref:Uncharacterized protein n=1 Tax=Flavobacterium taihuense TaxID=2857508 RepID=A0ABS6Y027_9FLAO|nr:hypothetical protein [Flavobacterium taihuense]MBW4362265.1 hypothetical protein [Flavobacterium taihuense]
MKTLKLIAVAIFLFVSTANHAQVSINVNFGTPPQWGPVGYSEVSYYYLPDVESYYDIRAHQFIFLSNGIWIRSGNLPNRYRNYDLYNGYKVVLNDYHGSRPYGHYKEHKVKYYRGYNKGHQENYRSASNYKPRHDDNHGNGNHNGNQGNHGDHGNGNNGHKNGKH